MERANRMVIKAARATISDSGLPKSCWHKVTKGCCLMLNQIPKQKGEDSPWMKMHKKELPKDYIKPIGSSLTYKLNQTNIRSKLDEKGASGILIGFNPQLLSYKIINSSGRIIDTKHIIFNDQKPIKILDKHDSSEAFKLPSISSPSKPSNPIQPPAAQDCHKIKEEFPSESSETESDNNPADEALVERNL